MNPQQQNRSESERVYAALRSMILSGGIQGGDVINQMEVAAQLGTSRSPVREAVARLLSERMLRSLPGRGVRVAHVGVRDLLEINQLRWLLEGFAARLAVERIPQFGIDELSSLTSSILAQPDCQPDEVEECDRRLHHLISHHCGNERLRDYIEQLGAEMTLARKVDIHSAPREMVESVVRIVDALDARDAAAAEREIRAHIDLFSHRLPDLVAKARAEPT